MKVRLKSDIRTQTAEQTQEFSFYVLMEAKACQFLNICLC